MPARLSEQSEQLWMPTMVSVGLRGPAYAMFLRAGEMRMSHTRGCWKQILKVEYERGAANESAAAADA